MAKFNDIIDQVKQLLKDSLTAENTELITRIDKQVDNIVSAHKETEEKLSETQDKLLEVVKETSFKSESEPNQPEGTQQEILSVDKAFDDAFAEIESKRK